MGVKGYSPAQYYHLHHNGKIPEGDGFQTCYVQIRARTELKLVSIWNTRTDLPATDEHAFANEKVKALVEALQYYNTFGYEGKEARAALAGMEKE